MRIREESLTRLASGEGFDVLILGGGVNGVAVLRELALNGVSLHFSSILATFAVARRRFFAYGAWRSALSREPGIQARR